MSDWSDICDAVIAELKGNIPALASVTEHPYAPWDPEELINDNKKHLACWPDGEGEVGEPETQGTHVMAQRYVVLYWEPGQQEREGMKLDKAASKTLLQLQNAIRARFYVETNQTLGGTPRLWYSGCTFPEVSRDVRWFAIALTAVQYISFTDS